MLGIPVLELLYNAELSDKKMVFMVLLLSGGFSAASTLTLTLFTTMRKQKLCLVAYTATIIFALIMPTIMTSKLGLMGAALSFLCDMALLFVTRSTISRFRKKHLLHIAMWVSQPRLHRDILLLLQMGLLIWRKWQLEIRFRKIALRLLPR